MPIALSIILGITPAISDEDSGVSNEENLESTKRWYKFTSAESAPRETRECRVNIHMV